MGRSVIHLVISLLLPTLSFSISVAPKSVFDEMFTDKQICPTMDFLKELKVMDGCKEVAYPTEAKIVNPNQKDLFLCLAIYDASHQICHYTSMRTNSPKDDVYKKELEKLIPVDSSVDICAKNSLSFAPLYSKTWHFFVEKDPAKEKNQIVEVDGVKCTLLCYKMNNKFDPQQNPLCAVLLMENNMIREFVEESKLPGEVVAPASNPEKPKDKVAEDTNPRNKPSSISVGTGSNTDKATAENNAKPKTLESEIKVEDQSKAKETQGSPTSPQIQNPQTPEKSKPQETKVDAPVPANAVSQGGSPGADAEVGKQASSGGGDAAKNAGSGDKGNTEVKKNEQKPEEAAIEESVNTDDQINEPERISAGAIEVPAGEKKDKNSKSEIISENTQDGFQNEQDEFGDEQNMRIGEDNVDQPKDLASDKNVKSLETSNQQDFQPVYHPKRNDEDESHFFTYFTIISVLCVAGYIGYHNKQKVLAIILEGRRSRGSRGRRRPSTASYRKLDCTLEEAVTSQCNSNVTHVIY